mmetsp:Transcript_62884/g.111792  ORF Transcript_62884/g.111792 Transcript_62884/m.111792 type:complete len:80 (-) Transcript_62884:6-245(-)
MTHLSAGLDELLASTMSINRPTSFNLESALLRLCQDGVMLQLVSGVYMGVMLQSFWDRHHGRYHDPPRGHHHVQIPLPF